MSKDLLRIIKKHRYLYFFTLFLFFFVTFYIYQKKPVEYVAQGSFRYIGPNGTLKTTKTDANGTITYENFAPGDSGLEIRSLVKSKTLNVNFNGGNGIYEVTSRSLNPEITIVEVNEFLDFILTANADFLKEKLQYTESATEKKKLEKLIEAPYQSFPLVVKAEKIEVIDNRYLVIFFGVILSFFASITAVILKERVDEV